jgi:hypothetical protein
MLQLRLSCLLEALQGHGFVSRPISIGGNECNNVDGVRRVRVYSWSMHRMMYKRRQMVEHIVHTSDGALWWLVAEIVEE